MDPLFYQNTYNVDWAIIAQQWIKMKESLPADQLHRLPSAPPPPPCLDSSTEFDSNEKYYEEQGEAPMELVRDETETNKTYPITNYSGSSANNYSYANLNQQVKLNIENKIQDQKSDDFFNSPKGQMKKKLLPAWIREGLEKMEREKQKYKEDNKQGESSNLNTDKDVLNEYKNVSLLPPPALESSTSDSDSSPEKEEIVPNKYLKLYPTWEDRLEDLMLMVRKNVMETLLEVTNQQIENISKKVCSSFSTVAINESIGRTSKEQKPGKSLGLVLYGASDEESDASSDKDDENSEDEDEKIKTSLERKVKSFQSIEKSINAYLENEEEAERVKSLKYSAEVEKIAKDNSYKSPEKYAPKDNFGWSEKEIDKRVKLKTTPTKLSAGPLRLKKTSRFSDKLANPQSSKNSDKHVDMINQNSMPHSDLNNFLQQEVDLDMLKGMKQSSSESNSSDDTNHKESIAVKHEKSRSKVKRSRRSSSSSSSSNSDYDNRRKWNVKSKNKRHKSNYSR